MSQILLIDDDAQIVTMLKKFLELEGHCVVTAPNGTHGLELLANMRFDIVVTDIIMPEKDGLEVLLSILKDQNRPKIIAMSGGSNSLDGEHLLGMAKMLKADAVLSKPLNLVVLGEKIREVLGT